MRTPGAAGPRPRRLPAPAGTVPGMGKAAAAAALYQCSECGWQSTRWAGRCGKCEEWGTVVEARVPARERRLAQARSAAVRNGRAAGPGRVATAAVPIADIDVSVARARPTGLGELDRVLGGGLVPGAVVLLAGEPGVGKSTLLLEAGAPAGRPGPGPYVTGGGAAPPGRLRPGPGGAGRPHLFPAPGTHF